MAIGDAGAPILVYPLPHVAAHSGRRIARLLFDSGVKRRGRTDAPPTPAAGGDASGREVLQRKCAQCHAATMWTALKQDRRAWESTLYRMVGRGALWTPEEIGAMAEYLAQIRGPAK